MTFGLTTAPWVFSRVMHPVKICLRMKGVSISSFIDDFFILAVTQELCSIHASWTEQILQWLGFHTNYPKSSLVPLQSLEYLGILIDLRSFTHTLPADKVTRLLDSCHQMSLAPWTTRRRLEALVGFLIFAQLFLPLGRMLLPLIKWMNSFSSPASRDRLLPTNPGLEKALRPYLVLSSCRPFCYEREFSIHSLCFSLPRPRSLFYQCPGPRLESVPVHLCFSSSGSHEPDHRQTMLFSGDYASDCSFGFSDFELSFNSKSFSDSPFFPRDTSWFR